MIHSQINDQGSEAKVFLRNWGEKNEQEGPLQRTTAGASPKEGKDGPDRMAKEPVRASPDRLCPVTTGDVSWWLSI